MTSAAVPPATRPTPIRPSTPARASDRPRVAFKALLLGQTKAPAAAPPRVREPANLGREPTKLDREPAHAPHEHAHDDREPARRPKRGRAEEDALDPALRHAAQIAPPLVAQSPSSVLAQSAPEMKARASLEELLPQVVRRIAWAGDARKGSVRMELGAGALAGGVVTVHADDGRVRVELSAPAGTDTEEWRQRLEGRLAARGIAVERVDVT
jgi:hypothetical protein